MVACTSTTHISFFSFNTVNPKHSITNPIDNSETASAMLASARDSRRAELYQIRSIVYPKGESPRVSWRLQSLRKWSRYEKGIEVFPEVRECAVRLVQGHRGEYSSLWAAVESIAPKIGCVPRTLNE